MSDSIRSSSFRSDELEKVDEKNFAVLASGGPLMEVLGVFFGQDGMMHVVCHVDGENMLFHPACLRMLTAFDPKRWLS